MLSFFIPWLRWVPYGVGAILAMIVTLPPAYFYGTYTGAAAERVAIEGEIAERTAELQKKRADDNVEISNFDRRDLCRELLPAGVPVFTCD